MGRLISVFQYPRERAFRTCTEPIHLPFYFWRGKPISQNRNHHKKQSQELQKGKKTNMTQQHPLHNQVTIPLNVVCLCCLIRMCPRFFSLRLLVGAPPQSADLDASLACRLLFALSYSVLLMLRFLLVVCVLPTRAYVSAMLGQCYFNFNAITLLY